MPKMKVGCYVRVSTESQIENYSIEEQIERLKAFCKAKDWIIYKIYTDAGYSGGNTDRPALKQMLEDIQHKYINMVVVYKLDRLSRSQKDTLTLIEDEFLNNKVDFVSVNENFDTSTPFGRAMIGILSVFAQLEKDQITERFTMGRIGRSKAGFFHGGSVPPTGYNYVDGKLEIDEYKALQVREIFSRYLKGYSINSIREYLDNKYGGWNYDSVILNILRNSTYTGKVKFNGIEYDGVHAPIIDKETFFKAQALLNERKHKTPFKATQLLTSIIYCKRCGAKYNSDHGYYKCYSRSKHTKKYIIDPNCKNKHWKIEKLDALIIDEIKNFDYDKILLSSTSSTEKTNTKNVKSRIKELNSQISKMIDLYQIKNIPIEEISKRIDEMQREKDALNYILLNPQKSETNKRDEFISAIKRTCEVLDEGVPEEKRMFVRSVIKAIYIDGETVSIDWLI